MSSCYCDYDPADFYRAVRPRARKQHKCGECGHPINPGERYERVTAKWDLDILTHKTCVYCLAQRDLLTCRSDCFCWSHGGLLEDIQTELDYGEPAPGVRFGLASIALERRRA